MSTSQTTSTEQTSMGFVRRAAWHGVWILNTRCFVDFPPVPSRTVFLAGVHRSGTTWLASALNRANRLRFIWEPFWRERVPAAHSFRTYQYLRQDDPAPEQAVAIDRFLRGRVRSEFSDAYNRRFLSSRRLIKETRSNLFLHWIVSRYPQVKTAMLFRHPCAVAASRRRLHWVIDLEGFLNQDALVEDHIAPFVDRLRGLEDEFDKLIAHWCIQHFVPLRMLRPGQVHMVFYESIVRDPEHALPPLLDHFAIQRDDRIFEGLAAASHSSGKQGAVSSGKNPAENWQSEVTGDELSRAMEILAWFGLDRLYGRDPYPREQALWPSE